jgi:flagellar M-ring protein FliF
MESFLRMDSNRRFALLAVVAGMLILAVVLARRASAPDYVTLFRDLDISGVGDITDRLTKASIPYHLEGQGTEIQVETADAARARVLLAKDGLPASGRPGMELFDRPAWGMTDFTQHITYRRALEGELARTIGTLRGVQRAQVHLGLPEETALTRQQRPAEAAVVVTLAPNTTLSQEQVQGIAQLVSGSVEQLTADHVTVLDDTGRPLTGDASGSAGLTTHQLDLQQQVEQHLATKVEQLLSSAIGPNDLKVQVAARLNFDQVERSIEAYDTAGKVLQNEQRSSGGGDSATAGQSATVVNNTYVNSRTMEKIVGETGNITRLTVSVMVNTRALKGDGALQADQRATLAQLARNAVGIDSVRGDQLSVVAIPFTDIPVAKPVPSAADAKTPGPTMMELVSRLAFPVVALLAVVVALLIGWRAAKPSRLAIAAPNPVSELGAARPDGSFAPADAQGRRLATEQNASPDAAARVIRAWLAEPS